MPLPKRLRGRLGPLISAVGAVDVTGDSFLRNWHIKGKADPTGALFFVGTLALFVAAMLIKIPDSDTK